MRTFKASKDWKFPLSIRTMRWPRYMSKHEQELLARALDCLSWSSLSWSMHRGMKDILLAHGKATMDHSRRQLATVLRNGVTELERSRAARMPEGVRAKFHGRHGRIIYFVGKWEQRQFC